MEIKPQYKHSKFGTFMFNLCAHGTKFLLKHRIFYYFMACTGGILMTFIGWLITFILAIASIFSKRIKFEKYYGIYNIKVGPDYGGGMDMGLMFCRDHKSSDSFINPHEGGHSFQNCLLGPLFPFLVAIPSATRYGIDEIKGLKEPYDAVGFEDAATQCGEYAIKTLESKRLTSK